MAGRRWYLALGVIMLAGLALRVWYIDDQKSVRPAIDGPYYHQAANLLADGEGFIQPLFHGLGLGRHHAADHPPGWIVTLAAPSVLGLDSSTQHRAWAALLGTGTIAAMAFLGRRVAGPRAGLLAAGIAALYPNFWVNEAYLMSETLVLLATALTLLFAYRFWDDPRPREAVALGVVLAVTILTRAEALLLAPLLVVPLALLHREQPVRQRLRLLALVTATTLVTVAPWAAYNLSRFEQPVLISTGLGYAMQVGACDVTFEGRNVGYWSFQCERGTPARIDGDTSTVDLERRRLATRYIGDHLDRLPVVVAARIGRTFGLYNPYQQLHLDRVVGHETTRSSLHVYSYYVLAAAAIVGTVVLRRRRVPVFPMAAVVLTVVLTVALIFGQTRYRAMAEVPIVLLAAVAADVALSRLRRGGRRRRTEADRAGSTDGRDTLGRASVEPERGIEPLTYAVRVLQH